MGGIALSTAVYGLYRLGLPTPWEPAKEPIPVSDILNESKRYREILKFKIVIWAGATSVGIYAIRLAKLSGLRVAT